MLMAGVEVILTQPLTLRNSVIVGTSLAVGIGLGFSGVLEQAPMAVRTPLQRDSWNGDNRRVSPWNPSQRLIDFLEKFSPYSKSEGLLADGPEAPRACLISG